MNGQVATVFLYPVMGIFAASAILIMLTWIDYWFFHKDDNERRR